MNSVIENDPPAAWAGDQWMANSVTEVVDNSNSQPQFSEPASNTDELTERAVPAQTSECIDKQAVNPLIPKAQTDGITR